MELLTVGIIVAVSYFILGPAVWFLYFYCVYTHTESDNEDIYYDVNGCGYVFIYTWFLCGPCMPIISIIMTIYFAVHTDVQLFIIGICIFPAAWCLATIITLIIFKCCAHKFD